MPLTKKQLTELKEQLIEEKSSLVGGAWNHEAEADFGGDLVDQSTGLTEQELRLELAEHDRERLLEIEDALRRLEDGTYGICLESGEEIPYPRLKAVPTAKYTIQCQEMLERRRFIRD